VNHLNKQVNDGIAERFEASRKASDTEYGLRDELREFENAPEHKLKLYNKRTQEELAEAWNRIDSLMEDFCSVARADKRNNTLVFNDSTDLDCFFRHLQTKLNFPLEQVLFLPSDGNYNAVTMLRTTTYGVLDHKTTFSIRFASRRCVIAVGKALELESLKALGEFDRSLPAGTPLTMSDTHVSEAPELELGDEDED